MDSLSRAATSSQWFQTSEIQFILFQKSKSISIKSFRYNDKFKICAQSDLLEGKTSKSLWRLIFGNNCVQLH